MEIPDWVQIKKYTVVSQLNKCLKFKSIRRNNNDCILYKITPRNAAILDIYLVVTLYSALKNLLIADDIPHDNDRIAPQY